MKEFDKYPPYRTPIIRRLMVRSYPYQISHEQLLAVVKFIDATREQVTAVFGLGECRMRAGGKGALFTKLKA
jgi:hypothetical protein